MNRSSVGQSHSESGAVAQVNGFFRETDKLMIQIPELPRPTLKELQRVSISRIRSIESDTSPTTKVTLNLGTVLRDDEEWVIDLECERRLVPNLSAVLGYQQAAWLVEHQDESPELMALLGKVYINFLGLVVVHVKGHRGFPYLAGAVRWKLAWDWFGRDLGQSGRLAVSVSDPLTNTAG